MNKIAENLKTRSLTSARSKLVPGRETATAKRFELIHKLLRQRICLLDYPPGTVLSEVALAEEFGVSRTPIRRVLHQLEFEGLVQIRNGVGTIVTDIDLKTFKDIYGLRMRLAEMMGELSPAQITSEHLAQMDRLIARAGKLQRRQNVKAYARLANDLQETLSSITGSSPLREVIELYYFRVARIWFTFLPKLDWNEIVSAQLAELTEMRAAMVRNDVRGVGQVRSLHLHGILARISRFLVEP
jgi:DNA-binding GntR family transcriptional regulator